MTTSTSTVVASIIVPARRGEIWPGYHRVCGVVSPDSDGLVEMAMASNGATFDDGLS